MTCEDRYEWTKFSDEELNLINENYGKLCKYREMYRSSPELLTLPLSYIRCKDKIKKIKVRPDDVWVISTPKSGTTWTQEVVWFIMTNMGKEDPENQNALDRFAFIDKVILFNFSDADMENYFEHELESLPSPRLIKTHLPFELLPDGLVDTCKVVFPSRNLKDTAISYFFHEQLFKHHDITCDVETYLGKIYRRGVCNFGGYWGMLESGLKRSEHPNVFFFWFEKMKADPRGVIVDIMKHLGKELSDEDVDKIDAYMRFDNYRKKCALNEASYAIYEGRGQFTRKGVVGDWKNYFTPELTQEYDDWIRTNLARLKIFDSVTVGYFQTAG